MGTAPIRGCAIPEPTRALCKGAWALGTACGKCERCLQTAPAEIARLRTEVASWKRQAEMVYDAWTRELGGLVSENGKHISGLPHPKRHLIDALVLSTRQLRQEVYAFWEAERIRKAAAALAVRDECEAIWRAKAEEMSTTEQLHKGDNDGHQA